MKKISPIFLSIVLLLSAFIISCSVVNTDSDKSYETMLDKFINGLKYDIAGQTWNYDFERTISFPGYYLGAIELLWHSDNTVSVLVRLKSRFDAVNKIFPTTDGGKIEVERLRIFLRLSPMSIPFNEIPVLLKKYENILKFGLRDSEITAKLYSIGYGEGEYPGIQRYLELNFLIQ